MDGKEVDYINRWLDDEGRTSARIWGSEFDKNEKHLAISDLISHLFIIQFGCCLFRLIHFNTSSEEMLSKKN